MDIDEKLWELVRRNAGCPKRVIYNQRFAGESVAFGWINACNYALEIENGWGEKIVEQERTKYSYAFSRTSKEILLKAVEGKL